MSPGANGSVERLRATATDLLASRVDEHLARVRWSAGELADHQQRELRRLLRHAIDASTFHQRRLGRVDVDHFTVADLVELPTMTKSHMMNHYDELVTDHRLSLALVEEHLGNVGRDPELLLGKYACLTSGGSSGRRGVYVWTVSDLADQVLGMSRAALSDLFALTGGIPETPIPYTRIVAPSAVHATRMMTELFSGRVFDFHRVSANLPIAELVRAVDASEPALLGGFPSILVQLAAEKAAGRLKATPVAITGGSEPFSPDMKARIEDAFGVAPGDMFGATEGLFGYALPGDDTMTLATDLAIIELVDNDNHPVARGVPSDKVLVTSLLNHAQPLIRYELSDSMCATDVIRDDPYPRVTVAGRNDDVLVWGQVAVHPLALRSVLVHHPAVTEYQVKQDATGVDVTVVAAGSLNSDLLESQLESALTGAGLARATATVTVAPSIPRHPLTGKVRRFVPLAPTA